MYTDYKLIYHSPLAKLDKASQERIVAGLKGLLTTPPKGDIKSLKGYADLYRLRIGSFRVIFNIDYQLKPLEIGEIFINSF